jgi:uncharacterized protein YndB with AHSA1/START domain/predicted enzyme related to lactoylglutathione lyase
MSAAAQQQLELTDRKIEKYEVFHQSLDAMWQRWTTHEGLKTFFGKDNQIELIPGGKFEIYFMMDQPEGGRGSEGCKVLSYLPNQFLSFSWNAPPEFPEVRNHAYKTWVVVKFQPIAPNETAVRIIHLGWPKDERWNPVYDYFNKAWDYVIGQLRTYNLATDEKQKSYTKVSGIGGVFFKAKDPKALKEWYKQHLGIPVDQYGWMFEWRQLNNPEAKGSSQWSIFKAETDYFLPSEKEYMLNYRVENMDLLYEDLKKEGVTICDKIESYDYGKFLHIMDPEGNKIELWQAIDDAFEK